jgi:membrane protein insertase Oxa1/YidC/SpoIIIJ
MMPAMYFMFATQTPSAFIIYWFLSNLLGFAQMKIIYKGLPDTILPDIKEVGPVEVAKPLKANPKLVSPKRKK